MGGPGQGIRFCGLNVSWLQPLIILLMVSYVYAVYVALLLLPALQQIHASRALDSHDTAFIPGGSIAFQSFIHDPHATRMGFTEFIVTTLIFHVLLILWAGCFIKAIVTAPGSVPVERIQDSKKWNDGLFEISQEDDQRIEDITVDHSTDLSNPELQAFIRNCILVERKKEKNKDQGHASSQVHDSRGLKRHCKTCQIFKPDRTHHCKVCNQSVGTDIGGAGVKSTLSRGG